MCSAGAGRFRLGDVPVPCRRSRSRARWLGGSFWAFSVDLCRAKRHPCVRGVLVGDTGGLGRVVGKKQVPHFYSRENLTPDFGRPPRHKESLFAVSLKWPRHSAPHMDSGANGVSIHEEGVD